MVEGHTTASWGLPLKDATSQNAPRSGSIAVRDCMSLFSVLIVEDQLRFREAFAHALEKAPDIRLVGMATDLQQGRKMFDQTRPDVLLVDLDLPGGSGIELIRHAAHVAPECEVMVISVFGDEQHVLSSIEAGATGYLLKDSLALDLPGQLRSLRAGGSPISPVIARRLLELMPQVAPEPAPRDDTHLSARETEILQLVARGLSNREIAEATGLSRLTIESHTRNIYRKLAVGSRTEAVFEARAQGLLH